MGPKRRLIEEAEDDDLDGDPLSDEAIEAELIEIETDDEDEAEEGWD